MIKLTVLSGPDAGSVFAPTTDTIVIGRGHDCDVVLHDSGVSRRHGKIQREAGNFIVSDLRTANGIFLNDHKTRISAHVLKNGDEIIFSRSRLRVDLPTSPDEALFPTTPGLTIDDALSSDSSPLSLPSNWQEGMTVFVSRSKLLAALEKQAAAEGHPIHGREGILARVTAWTKRTVLALKNSLMRRPEE
ncbi:MAG: FHA domain-containing protein [Deltaproteobacteria bacterium]|nr:FHA domain-containing protein [Deltaproteobacteria bacterium]